MPWAYLLEGWKGSDADAPWRTMREFARIRRAGRLQGQKVAGGLLVGPAALLQGAPINRADYAEPEPCADNPSLHFLAPKTPPTLASLARANIDHHPRIELSCGICMRVAPATSAPRKISFGVADNSVATAGEYADDYGRAAFRLYDLQCELDAGGSDEATAILEAEHERALNRCIVLAAQSCYHVTEEMLTYGGWITTADIPGILRAVWGIDQGKS